MSMKLLYIMLTLISICQYGYTQTIQEALLYSHNTGHSSSRTAAVMGVNSILGADIAASLINPAGLASYQKGEFSNSPNYLATRSICDFKGVSHDKNTSDFKFLNFGLVFVNRSESYSDWKKSVVSISFLQRNNFDYSFRLRGTSEGSIVDRFTERANGKDLDELDGFEAGLAYDVEAIFDSEGDLNYENDITIDQSFLKNQNVNNEGGIRQLNLGIASQYKRYLQLGLNVGLSFLNNNSTKRYYEEAIDKKSAFRILQFSETLNTQGLGISLNAGAILKLLKYFRLGLSIETPTYYTLYDTYSNDMSYSYADDRDRIIKNFEESPDGEFTYNYSSPWKINTGAGFIMKIGDLNGFFSTSINYLNYQNNSFDLTSNSNSTGDALLSADLKRQIKSEFTHAFDYNFGAELAYNIFRVRGGYGIVGSPYYEDKGRKFESFSFGTGVRFDRFFIDLGVVKKHFDQGYLPYKTLSEENLQLAKWNKIDWNTTLTFGYKFS